MLSILILIKTVYLCVGDMFDIPLMYVRNGIKFQLLSGFCFFYIEKLNPVTIIVGKHLSSTLILISDFGI